MPSDPVTESLLRSLDEAFDRHSWHGPNLRGSLRGLSVEQAIWRPGRGRHNIWETTLHAAYWKYAARRRLLALKRGSFALKGSNWFPSPARPTEAGWKQAIALLVSEHQRLREAIVEWGARGREAGNVPRERSLRVVRGVVAHDLYHAGQIQLLKRLAPAGKGA